MESADPNPRPRPLPAIYRRRRLGALAILVAVALAVALGARSCGGEEGPGQLSAEQARRAELAANPVELTLSFSGDLLIHSPVWARALALGGGEEYDFAPLFAELRPFVAGADLAFCHVETPMTPAPPQSFPLFNTPPELARAIAATGWDACDTASNHALDQGQEGVAATLRALDRAGIEHTGTARSKPQRSRPLIVESGGARIGYLAYTSDTNGIPLPRPYSVNLIDRERILADARAAREAGADAVVVNLHWGADAVGEYLAEPSPEQRRLVARLARAPEITAIVGQGPHVVQPIREIAAKAVAFSEGNLISNQGAATGLPAPSQDGYIALLELVVDGEGARVADVRYVPIWVDHLDHRVLPVGRALAADEADRAALEASYERTVDVVGRGYASPEPARLP